MKFIVIFLFFLIISGCKVVDKKNYLFNEQPVISGVLTAKQNQDKLIEIAKNNRLNYDMYFKEERDSDENKVCLALSGGGSRASAFSLGVMKGLNEKGMLSDLSYISSVSGGGYASYYFYVHQMENVPIDDLFNVDEKYLDRVANTPLLDSFWLSWSAITNGLCNLFWGPINFFNFSSGKASYTCGRSNYYTSLVSQYGGENDELKFSAGYKKISELKAFLKNKNLPAPIFNTSLLLGKKRKCKKREEHTKYNWCDSIEEYCDLQKGSFEITPNRIGSEWIGYNQSIDFQIVEAVTISGAALDKADSKYCGIGNVTGNRLGADIKNFESTIHGYQTQKDINISDGGFIDNLGIFPLVKRQCDRIISVDSGYDPFMLYQDYIKLKTMLELQHNLVLSVPSIENESFYNNKECDDLNPKHDPDYEKCFKADSVVKSVHKGTIGLIPMIENNALKLNEIDISFIKLSIEKNKKIKKGSEYINRRIHNGKFPQEPTSDQNFSVDQFWSYFYLGYSAVESLQK
ncbi:MAG: patatin-like phospholipase family protein [Marinicella sp.]